jgi:hypothetical protein
MLDNKGKDLLQGECDNLIHFCNKNTIFLTRMPNAISLPKGNKAEAQAKSKAMETLESNIHIGHLIREQLKADNRSVSWLAREIHCTRNNVYKIFNKPSLDGDLILKISVAMNFNFFQYYTASFLESIKTRTGEGKL